MLILTFAGRVNLLVILLLVGLEGGHGNTVQITLAGLGDATTSLLLILLEDTDLLKSLHDLTVNGTRGVGVVGWAGTAVAGRTVNLAETANTNGLAHVDVTGDSSGTNVEPVNGLWWELLGWTGLDGVNPTCRGNLVSMETFYFL